jgi:hypothetical protein
MFHILSHIWLTSAIYLGNKIECCSVDPTNSTIHTVNTMNKNQFHRSIASLSCFQKGAYYASIKIFNSLPSNITALIDKHAQFKVALKRYLITHSSALLRNLYFRITQSVSNAVYQVYIVWIYWHFTTFVNLLLLLWPCFLW